MASHKQTEPGKGGFIGELKRRKVCRTAIELDPEFLLYLSAGSIALAMLDRHDEAIGQCETVAAATATSPSYLSTLACIYVWAGQTDKAGEVTTELRDRSSSEYVSPYLPAGMYGCMGDLDRAFELLDEAIDEHSPFLWNLPIDPVWSAMREDRRYIEALRRVGLEPVALPDRRGAITSAG